MPKQKDGITAAFIPLGMDSPELIHIATGLLISPLGDEIIALLNSPLARAVEHEGD